MARADEALLALKYQVATFVAYIKATYTGDHTDLDGNAVFHIEEFDETNAESYSPTLGKTNYSFIITRFTNAPRGDYPVGWLSQVYNADIIIVRKSLRTKDRTNNRNIIQFGGTDDASGAVTSIERIATDLQKWFRVRTQGGKLSNGTTEQSFKCDITSIGQFSQAGDFCYKVLPFEAYSMETVTIS